MGEMSNQWAPIDGETPIDPSHLKDKAITTRGELNRAEAENVRKAIVKYLVAKPSRRSAPFDLSWFCRLHYEMFGDVWLWAGELRKTDLNIGVPWPQVSSRLMDLVSHLAFWKTTRSFPFVEQAARLHYHAVAVHPFQNGNGRWARMLASIWLVRHGQAIIRWPEETMGTAGNVREEYLAALRVADQGDYEPLIELHRRFSAE